MSTIRTVSIGLLVSFLVTLSSCPMPNQQPASSSNSITAFKFQGYATYPGLIDEALSTISVTLPYGTIRTSLVAVFTTTGSSVTVDGVAQVSGVTANSYTNPITYRVTAADASTRDYAVTAVNAPILGIVSTLAGVPRGNGDGMGSSAWFYDPHSITADGTNLYVADTGNNTIRKIVIASGEATTLAGTASIPGSNDGTGSAAQFNTPAGIAIDGTNLYVSDMGNHTIRKVVIATGVVSTLAGTAGSSGGDDGTGSTARFNGPIGITTDGTNLYVADHDNNTIRQIVINTGVVTTLAGTAGIFGYDDGIGGNAHFAGPQGIVRDGGSLYVSDTGNHTIRKIDIGTAEVTTLAGTAWSSGSGDGSGTEAQFNEPRGIASDGTSLYVADAGNHTIRKIDIATAAVTTLAGNAGLSGSEDGTGSAARFKLPRSVASAGTDLYVADTGNGTIRKLIIASGEVTTLAGTAGTSSKDGTGSAAGFLLPHGIAVDGGNLYVADTGNNLIRKITIATAEVTSLAGTAATKGYNDGTGSAARFGGPEGVALNGGNLYVADTGNHMIRKIVISTAAVTTFAGTGGLSGGDDGVGSAARFSKPSGISSDGTNLYVADSGNHTIRKIVILTGQVTTLAGTAGLSGGDDGVGSAARFNEPNGITTDGTNIYVADRKNSTIRKLIIATGEVTTLAGTAGLYGSSDGTGSTAGFAAAGGVATDGTYLYVGDSKNHTIRKVVIATGVVTTLAGTAGLRGSDDGTGGAARFRLPEGIAMDRTSLYVADRENHTIRMIR
jgi:hypothetical protein